MSPNGVVLGVGNELVALQSGLESLIDSTAREIAKALSDDLVAAKEAVGKERERRKNLE